MGLEDLVTPGELETKFEIGKVIGQVTSDYRYLVGWAVEGHGHAVVERPVHEGDT